MANKLPKSDVTVVYKRTSADRTKRCKRCASRIKPGKCVLVSGAIYRRGTCLLWTAAP